MMEAYELLNNIRATYYNWIYYTVIPLIKKFLTNTAKILTYLDEMLI